jgi:hypothetical protein
MKKSYLKEYNISREIDVYNKNQKEGEPLLFREKHIWLYKFPNNYGASVINEENTYGLNKDKDGKFEVAIVKFDGDDWDFYGSNYIHRMLDFEDVAKLLSKIKRKKK